MSENESFSTMLREMADQIDRRQTTALSPDLDIAEAVRRLRESFKSAELEIEIKWRDYKGECEVEYKVSKSYKEIAKSESLANVVRKAIAEYAPNDTLDRLASMMPAQVAVEEAVKS